MCRSRLSFNLNIDRVLRPHHRLLVSLQRFTSVFRRRVVLAAARLEFLRHGEACRDEASPEPLRSQGPVLGRQIANDVSLGASASKAAAFSTLVGVPFHKAARLSNHVFVKNREHARQTMVAEGSRALRAQHNADTHPLARRRPFGVRSHLVNPTFQSGTEQPPGGVTPDQVSSDRRSIKYIIAESKISLLIA